MFPSAHAQRSRALKGLFSGYGGPAFSLRFWDGRLVTLTETVNAAESQGLEVRDVENLREHYKRTLRMWVEGLRAHHEQLLRHVSEETYRIWLLYMAGSSAAFDRGDIAVYQVLLRRYQEKHSALPLTREDWYEGEGTLAENVYAKSGGR